MKKIKRISVRLSQKDYEVLMSDYLWYKNRPELTIFLYKQEIKTFSDYIRLMLEPGSAELIDNSNK